MYQENEDDLSNKPTETSKNVVYIGQETFQNDPQNGEEVDFSGAGKIVVKPDGSKCLEVTEIEGVPVMASEAEEGQDPNLKRIDEIKGLMRSKINDDMGEGE